MNADQSGDVPAGTNGANATPVLGLVAGVLARLEAAGVSHCHWKSNEHLVAALAGDTDLDMLFDGTRQADVRAILAGSGLARFQSAWFLDYPGIEDHVGIDEATGRVVHFHVHFRLVAGEKRVKSYELPFAGDLLAGRHRPDHPPVYVSAPEDEALVLLVRLLMKRQRVDGAAAAGRTAGDARREFDWLRRRADGRRLAELTERRLGSSAVAPVQAMLVGGLSDRELARMRAACAGSMAGWRRMPAWRARLIGAWRWIGATLARVNRRLGWLDQPVNRTLAGGGMIIAVLGSDGSGKSTQIARLTARLRRKVDVLQLYMGSGNGAAAWHRRLLNPLVRRFQRAGKRPARGAGPAKPGRRRSPLVQLGKAVFALSLALEKGAKLRQAARARGRGTIVLCDRYPQSRQLGYNDGPLLGQAGDGMPPWLARWELRQYRLAEEIQPDLVLKLRADPAVLAARRAGEMDTETAARKQDGVMSQAFGPGTRVVELDAAATIDEVERRAMAEIGRLIARRAPQS